MTGMSLASLAVRNWLQFRGNGTEVSSGDFRICACRATCSPTFIGLEWYSDKNVPYQIYHLAKTEATSRL